MPRCCLILLALAATVSDAGDPDRGLRFLLNEPVLPPDFDDGVIENVWRLWPAGERAAVEDLPEADRRAAVFARYGLQPRPENPRLAAGYVRDADGDWSMNCFACHAGSVAGGPTRYGLPNTHTALHSLTEDVLATKLRQFKLPSHMDVGHKYIPLNRTDGTTNAVVFGVALGAGRDRDMNPTGRRAKHVVHHDLDAPPWWNVKKKRSLYADGFAPKNARVLMQFMMLPVNDAERFYGWEKDFEDVLAFIESVEPPEWPFGVDAELAGRGRVAFEENCSRCHGTYGDDWTYPETIVPIEEVGTDRVRLDALTQEHRRWMKEGWLSRYGEDDVLLDPGGYVAPPLDGIWASAPYLHNGSVPTLWHLMHPADRPAVWRRTKDGYDEGRVGLAFEEVDAVPADATDAERRGYRDAGRFGMSNAGHDFPDELTEPQKRAVLEYLKTL